MNMIVSTLQSRIPALGSVVQLQPAPLFSGKKDKRGASGGKSIAQRPANTPTVKAPPVLPTAVDDLSVEQADELLLSVHAEPESHPAAGSPTNSNLDASGAEEDVSDGESLPHPVPSEYLRFLDEQRRRQHEQWGRRFAPLGQLTDGITDALKNQTRRATGAAANAFYSLRDATTQAASTARKKAQRALANALKSASEAIDPGSDSSVHGSVHSSTEA